MTYAYLASTWEGPCHCVMCERHFDNEERPVMLGNDAYCKDCAAVVAVDETLEEELV